jgi:hypothetical protein
MARPINIKLEHHRRSGRARKIWLVVPGLSLGWVARLATKKFRGDGFRLQRGSSGLASL